MKAIAYLRVSGKGQVDGDGFARQEAAIRKYADAEGIDVVEVFKELGVSGEVDGMDRPAWVRAIAYTIDTGVKTILVEKLDRLARLQGIQEYILLDMRKRGLAIVPVDDPSLGSDDPMRVLFRQIIGAIAQYDKTMIILKTRAARERIRATGAKCEGRKEFGHRSSEIAAVDLVRGAMREKVTAAEITRRLNASGLLPRMGRVWHQVTVTRVIKRIQKEQAA